MRVSVVLWFLSAFVTSACDPVAFRRVSLQLPLPEAQRTVTVSTVQPDVQEALGLIDTVVISGGPVRYKIQSFTNNRALVAFYYIPSAARQSRW